MYFVNEVTEELAKAREAVEKNRKRGLNPSFSSVGVLMPGRKPLATSAKGKKRSVKTPAGGKTKTG
jgi:hypothetical protein